MAEERAVAVGVAGLGVVEVAHRLVGDEERRHRADALEATVGREALLESRAALLELLVDGRVAQPAQYGKSGGGCQRIAGERPRLVDVPARGKAIHDLGASAERCQRQPAADDLAEDREIRDDTEALLRSAARDAETRDHLVEDEECGLLSAKAAQGPE